MLTKPHTPQTTPYAPTTRYGLDIVASDETVLKTVNFATEQDRDGYRLWLKANPGYYPVGAAFVYTWEREMEYRPIPRTQAHVRNKRAAGVVYQWGWA